MKKSAKVLFLLSVISILVFPLLAQKVSAG